MQARILKRLHQVKSQEGSGSLYQHDLLSGNTIPEPKDSKNYRDMMKAAELEILIAECYNAQGKELEKIYSFKRATELYLGILVSADEYEHQVYYSNDVHSTITKISPYLVKMLLELAKHEEQEIQMAALRGVEFLLEKLGCTLDNYMIDILRGIVNIYPNKKALDASNEPMSHSPSDTLPPMTNSMTKDANSKHFRKDIRSEDFTKLKGKCSKATIVKDKSSSD